MGILPIVKKPPLPMADCVLQLPMEAIDAQRPGKGVEGRHDRSGIAENHTTLQVYYYLQIKNCAAENRKRLRPCLR